MLERIVEWQLEYPGGTRSELEHWIEEKVAKGEIQVPAELARPNDDGPERKRARVEEPTEERP